MTGHQRKVQTHQPHRGPPLSTLRARLWSVVLLATMICVWVSTSPTSARDINLRVYGGQKRGLDPVEATTQDHAHNKRDDGLNLEKRFTSTRNVELGAPSSRDESSAAIAFNGLDKRSSESEKPKPCDPCCKNACAYYNNCNNICLRSPTCKVCQPPPKPPGSKSRRDLPAPPNADESNTGHVYDKRTADGPFDTGIGTPSSLHERDAGGSPPQIQLADSHLVSKRELVDLKPAAAYLTERNNGPCDACCSNTCFVNGTCDKPCYGPSTCSGCPGFKLPPAHAEPALKREEPLLSPREDFEHGDDNHASGHVKRSRADLSHAATVDALERRDLVCSPCCPSVCAAFGLCGTTCLGPCDCGVAKRSAVFAEIAPREHYDGDAVPTQKRDPQAHRGVSRLPRALPETSTALEHGAASRTTKRSVIGGTEARNLQTSTVPAIYSRTERRDMHLQLPTLHKRGCDACCNVPCGCAGVKNADCSTCSDTLSGIAPAPQAGCETNPWIKRSPSTPPSLDRPLSGRELKSLARADVDSSTLSQRRVEEVMVSSYDCPACCASKTCFVCDCSSGALSLAERKAASPLTIDADAATRPQRRSELMEGSPDICPACCTNPGWCNGACGCGGDYRPRSLSLPGARLTASVAESLQDRTTHAARRVSAMDFDSDPPGQLQQRSELVALDTIDCPTCCANPSTCSECECYETPPLDANLAHRELTIASVTHLERRTEFAKDTGILRTRDGTKDCPPCCLSQSCAPGTVCTGCQPPATNGLEAPESLLTGRAERRNVRDTSTLAMRSPQGGTQEASILKVRAPQNEGPCEDCCFDVVIPCGIEHCSGCPGYQARSIASPVEGASVSLTQSLDRRDAKDMLFGHPAQTRSVRDENEGKDMPTLYVRTSHSSQPASTGQHRAPACVREDAVTALQHSPSAPLVAVAIYTAPR
ncbi:hypothetical protein CBOM_01045 [Ceraceosorus bombacis]|uniref:Uncharacterized protein n=1 Tax=Ceraceosorus bombacis TaxID=401625 RepID=A0A0N7L988_9BASI|nr:hypothetical protein CBOM_01045 [Ceraceosorus bombacis]